VARDARTVPWSRVQVPQSGHAGAGQNPGDCPGTGAAAQRYIRRPLAVLHASGQDIGNEFYREWHAGMPLVWSYVLKAVQAVGPGTG
jgi:hypothetical protein